MARLSRVRRLIRWCLRVFHGFFAVVVGLIVFLVAYLIAPASGQRGCSNKPLTGAETPWFWQNPLPQGNFLHGVSFVDANNGTAVGDDGAIIRTTDGGHSWIIQSSGTTSGLYGVSFADASNGTAVGSDGTILRTTDGGTDWVSQTSGTSNDLFGVSFSDTSHGTAVGGNGTLLRTTDG